MGTTTHHGPPAWTYVADCSAFADGSVDTAVLERCKEIARDVLWRASGRRFGTVTVTVRPVLPVPRAATACEPPGGVFDALALSPARPVVRSVRLPGPVQQVTAVRVDGVALPASAYTVKNHTHLVRLDGDSWPLAQDLSLPDDATGTWAVDYVTGLPLTAAGEHAYSVYVCELYKAATGGKNRLPARVEGVFRHGINVDFADDNLDLLSKGRTGIPDVDAWLAATNPYGVPAPSVLLSPDLPTFAATTQPSP